MSTIDSVARLRGMIEPAGCAGGGTALSDDALGALLDEYPCYELAAYHACLRLAQNSELRLADGTSAPSQENYWLRMAQVFRPSRSGSLCRADEAEANCARRNRP